MSRQCWAALATVAVAALCYSIMFWHWRTGRSVPSAIAGFFPFGDAETYVGCANALIDLGDIPSSYLGMCQRRPIAISVLASLLAIGARDLHIALLLQAAVVSAAVAALVREVARLTGGIGALLFSPCLSLSLPVFSFLTR